MPVSKTRAELTVDVVRRQAAAMLSEAGIDSAQVDARLLLQHVLGLDHARLAASPDRAVTAIEAVTLARLIARRTAHEPVARILGEKEFWSLRLTLGPDTLVPRPDTETIVAAALTLVDPEGELRIADLGTGSGAILLALLSELPLARGIGTDISPAALHVARANAARLGLAPRAAFAVCDYAAALRGPFDLIVSNPPYIPSGDIAGLDADVRDHDPLRALDGGSDGLAGYRAIAQAAPALLAPEGVVVVELGAGQAEDVTAAFGRVGLRAISAKRDISGHIRALVLAAPP